MKSWSCMIPAIRRVEELDTDDDDFPQYQIEMIRKLIGEL